MEAFKGEPDVFARAPGEFFVLMMDTLARPHRIDGRSKPMTTASRRGVYALFQDSSSPFHLRA